MNELKKIMRELDVSILCSQSETDHNSNSVQRPFKPFTWNSTENFFSPVVTRTRRNLNSDFKFSSVCDLNYNQYQDNSTSWSAMDGNKSGDDRVDLVDLGTEKFRNNVYSVTDENHCQHRNLSLENENYSYPVAASGAESLDVFDENTDADNFTDSG